MIFDWFYKIQKNKTQVLKLENKFLWGHHHKSQNSFTYICFHHDSSSKRNELLLLLLLFVDFIDFLLMFWGCYCCCSCCCCLLLLLIDFNFIFFDYLLGFGLFDLNFFFLPNSKSLLFTLIASKHLVDIMVEICIRHIRRILGWFMEFLFWGKNHNGFFGVMKGGKIAITEEICPFFMGD